MYRYITFFLNKCKMFWKTFLLFRASGLSSNSNMFGRVYIPKYYSWQWLCKRRMYWRKYHLYLKTCTCTYLVAYRYLFNIKSDLNQIRAMVKIELWNLFESNMFGFQNAMNVVIWQSIYREDVFDICTYQKSSDRRK